MRPLLICGDSFNIGIGCIDLHSEPYGCILAQYYGIPLVNLAKGSSSNYSIFLQVRHAVELNPAFVIVSFTSVDRTEWFPTGSNPPYQATVKDVNYHQYPPYGPGTYHVQLDHPFKGDPEYKGKLLTEQYGALFDYEENGHKSPKYYSRFRTEPSRRLKTIRDYFLDVYSETTKRDYDLGLFAWAHLMLKNRDIPHLILCHEPSLLETIPERNILNHSWFQLANQYPDEIKSLHSSPQGHRATADQIIEKIEREGLIEIPKA